MNNMCDNKACIKYIITTAAASINNVQLILLYPGRLRQE